MCVCAWVGVGGEGEVKVSMRIPHTHLHTHTHARTHTHTLRRLTKGGADVETDDERTGLCRWLGLGSELVGSGLGPRSVGSELVLGLGICHRLHLLVKMKGKQRICVQACDKLANRNTKYKVRPQTIA